MTKPKQELGRTGIFERQLIQWIKALMRSKIASIIHGGILWTAICWLGTYLYCKVEEVNSIPEIKKEIQEIRNAQINNLTEEDLHKIARYCKEHKINFHNLTALQIRLIREH